jgi:hypothetical protein
MVKVYKVEGKRPLMNNQEVSGVEIAVENAAVMDLSNGRGQKPENLGSSLCLMWALEPIPAELKKVAGSLKGIGKKDTFLNDSVSSLLDHP